MSDSRCTAIVRVYRNGVKSFTNVKIEEKHEIRGHLGYLILFIKHFLIACKEKIELTRHIKNLNANNMILLT